MIESHSRFRRLFWDAIFRHKLLAAIILLAFFLRVWGISYGLPQQFIGDEFLQVAAPLKMLDEKTLIPSSTIFYHQPLSAYISGIGIVLVLSFELLSGQFANIYALRDFYAVNAASLLIVPRFLSAFLGTLAVFLLYLAGRDLFNKRVGLIAAFFAATDFLLVYVNHSGRVWGYMAFFIALALWATVRLFNRDSVKNYFVATVAVLLAIANHLPGLFTVIPILVARFSFKNKRIWQLLGAVVLGTFLILLFTPRGLGALLLRFHLNIPALSQVVFQTSEVPSSSLVGAPIAERMWQPLVTLFNFSPVFLILFFVSLFLLWRTDRKKFFFLASFPVAYYLFIGPFFSFGWVTRTLVPLSIYLVFLSAYATDCLVEYSQRFFKSSSNLIVFVTVLVLPSLIFSFWFDLKLRSLDTRTQAIEWVEQNLPVNSRIVIFSQSDEVLNQNRAVLELLSAVAPGKMDTRQRTLLEMKESDYPKPFYFSWDARRIPITNLPPTFFKDNKFRYYFRAVWGNESRSYPGDFLRELPDKKLLVKFSPLSSGTDFVDGDLLNMHNMVYPVKALLASKRFGPTVEIYQIKP